MHPSWKSNITSNLLSDWLPKLPSLLTASAPHPGTRLHARRSRMSRAVPFCLRHKSVLWCENSFVRLFRTYQIHALVLFVSLSSYELVGCPVGGFFLSDVWSTYSSRMWRDGRFNSWEQQFLDSFLLLLHLRSFQKVFSFIFFLCSFRAGGRGLFDSCLFSPPSAQELTRLAIIRF